MKTLSSTMTLMAGCCLAASVAQADDLLPFTSETMAEIRNDYAGRPFLLTLWSVDCAPCRIDLEKLGGILDEQPELPIVLVAADPPEAQGEALEILEEYGLGDFPSWIFADSFFERLRFSIDPSWYGELPRSYFFDDQHNSSAHSGIISDEMLAGFLSSLP